MQITHVVVHTPEQAREIIREACEIANDFDTDSRGWELAFREACRLLGQRWTVAYEPQTVPLPALPFANGGNLR